MPDAVREDSLFSHPYTEQADHGTAELRAGNTIARANLFSEPADSCGRTDSGHQVPQAPRNPFQYPGN